MLSLPKRRYCGSNLAARFGYAVEVLRIRLGSRHYVKERHAELAEVSLPLSKMITAAGEMLRQAQHDVLNDSRNFLLTTAAGEMLR